MWNGTFQWPAGKLMEVNEIYKTKKLGVCALFALFQAKIDWPKSPGVSQPLPSPQWTASVHVEVKGRDWKRAGSTALLSDG